MPNPIKSYEDLFKLRVRLVLVFFSVVVLIFGFYLNHLLQLSIKNSLKVQRELLENVQSHTRL